MPSILRSKANTVFLQACLSYKPIIKDDGYGLQNHRQSSSANDAPASATHAAAAIFSAAALITPRILHVSTTP